MEKNALRLSQIVGIIKRLNDKLLNWVKKTKNVPNNEDASKILVKVNKW